jgi:tripartite-type tricarboxylate transporter receptor subunit TctC
MIRRIFSIAAALLLAATAAHAEFPERPVRLVVPYSAGGSADTLARALAESMRKTLGQPVIVENRPGGNTSVGAQMVTAATPDGYTLLLATGSTVVTNPLLYAKLNYNPATLVPVGRVAVSPLVVEVGPSVPVTSFPQLLQLAKSKPGRLNYASTGSGSVIHLATLLLESQAGISMTHIPFNGSSPALTAVLGGDVQLFVDSIASSMQMIKAGRLRALAVTTPQRLSVMPDVPAVAETFPGFDASAWYGVLAPARTPVDVVTKVNAAIGVALVDKAFRDQFEALGLVIPAPASASAFGEIIRQEKERWAPIVKANKLVLE